MWGAHLEGANLNEAHLKGAHLKEAHLEGARLEKANLEGANLKPEQLSGVETLSKATMPDGTKYEDWVEKDKPDWTQSKQENDNQTP